jgi:hypothetical protein
VNNNGQDWQAAIERVEEGVLAAGQWDGQAGPPADDQRAATNDHPMLTIGSPPSRLKTSADVRLLIARKRT